MSPRPARSSGTRRSRRVGSERPPAMSTSTTNPRKRRPYVRVVGPRLAKLLSLVFALFALTSINSIYLTSVTFMQWATGALYENYFYHLMAFGHVVLGAILTLPVLVFGVIHMRNAHDRPNRRAVRMGYALFAMSIVLLITGFLLVRMQGFAPVKAAATRTIVYWIHVIAPLLCAWLFILHRLAGKRIKWKIGARWAAVGAVFAIGMLLLHSRHPQEWDVVGPKDGEQYFLPALSRTATGDFIPVEAMLNDKYCLECHADVHASWSQSAHRFSSFNNPAYLFSRAAIRARRLYERDGHYSRRSSFCAGMPRSGALLQRGVFDDPKYDDPDYDLTSRPPVSQAGITCTVMSRHHPHQQTPRGNGSTITIDEAHPLPVYIQRQRSCSEWVNQAAHQGQARPCTRRPSSSPSTRPRSSAAPATRCTSPSSSTTTSGSAGRTTTTRSS